MIPIIELESERLALKQMTKQHSNFIYQLRSNPLNGFYFGIEPYQSVDQAREFVDSVIRDLSSCAIYFWVIVLKETNEQIGTICLWSFTKDKKKAEVGYELLVSSQGNGYASEALKRVQTFSKVDLQMNGLEAITNKDHTASLKLLQKLGFEEIGDIFDVYPDTDEDSTMKVFRCLFTSV